MTRFAVWAPRPAGVELVLDGERLPMRSDADSGWWRLDVDVPSGGTTYAFSLDGGEPRADPRGMRLPDGLHGFSCTFDPGEFGWTDDGWSGRPLEGSVVYEAHVGTFTPGGTLDSAVERLDHLVELGADVVELLPLATFPGRHNWGYDGAAPYSVHETYGGPVALQRFVDAAHGRGLAVCLDVVYNHLGPDGNYLPEFGPYFTDVHPTPWGKAVNLDGPGSDEVRGWVLDNAEQWLRDFHVDGLRLDAVHALHDERALPILEEMSARVDRLSEELGRRLWLVAESDRNDPGTVTPRGTPEGLAVAGWGVHAQWADDIHHALHVALTGETQGYYADFAGPDALAKVMRTPFFHDGTWSSFRGRAHGRPVDVSSLPGWRFVGFLQDHDQVGNRAAGDRLSARLSPGRLACGAAILLCSPYTPMLFMGEEWGASTPWQFFTDHTDPEIAAATAAGRVAEFVEHGWDESVVPDPQDPATFERSKLDWSELDAPPHARLLEFYRALIALRRERKGLRDARLELADVSWDAGSGRFTMQRGEHVVLVNLGHERLAFDFEGEVLLSWDPLDPGGPGTPGQTVLPPDSAAILASPPSRAL
ncbi:MAG TPA: malto-oligosyltrehalose trehalohydrolase [Nocardioidaceae bacterium]|nr:malto-oligosyltrehalose trehalohydrolase [Nocardioidaceae bacterium]